MEARARLSPSLQSLNSRQYRHWHGVVTSKLKRLASSSDSQQVLPHCLCHTCLNILRIRALRVRLCASLYAPQNRNLGLKGNGHPSVILHKIAATAQAINVIHIPIKLFFEVQAIELKRIRSGGERYLDSRTGTSTC